MNSRFDPSPTSRRSRLGLLAALAFAASTGAVAQDNNSYATMLQNNAIRQSNLTQQMININASRGTASGGSSSGPNCMPPYDLMLASMRTCRQAAGRSALPGLPAMHARTVDPAERAP
jgi:hypothetical protein